MLVEVTRPSFDLAALIHPVDPAMFFRDYWQQRPLVVHRKSPQYYHRLLTLTDVDHVLQFCRPGGEEILVVQDQARLRSERYLTSAGSLRLGQLYEAYHEGYTIILNGLERFWHPLAQFCQSLKHFLNHRVAANMYLAPRQSVSLKAHYDTHDIFVLQTDGAKHWKVHERPLPTPLVGSEQPLLSETELPALLHDVQLEAGDLMYLPRGFVHHASTADVFSLHVAVGVYPAQWVDLLIEALKALSLEDERLRKALPVGFMDRPELLPALQEQCRALAAQFARYASAEDGVARLTEQFVAETTPVPDGHFRQLEERDAIGSDTRVTKRPGLKCRVRARGPRATIQFPGRAISGPSNIVSSLQFIAKADTPFTARELPGDQSQEGKIALVRRLVRGGLLKSVADSNSDN